MKRLKCNFLLTILMSMVGMSSFAQFSGAGSGTESDPYQITNAVQLNEVRYHLDKAFILKNDIDLTAYLEDESPNLGWLPIGTYDNRFVGSFDGNNKTISGLWIARGTTDYVGLFGRCNNASITNLTLKDVNIKGQHSVGALCGYIYNGSITNCLITGRVEGDKCIGGAIGQVLSQVDDGYSLITASVDVIGNKFVGGIIGFADQGNASDEVSITSCFVQGNVLGDTSVGGIMGSSSNLNKTMISGCGFSGNVKGSNYLGGIVGGSNLSDRVSLEKCFSFVTITNTSNNGKCFGGLCGRLIGSASDCVSRGSVSGLTNTGGLFGYADNGTIQRCYFEGTVKGTGGKVGGLIGEVGTGCNFYSSNVSIATSVSSYNATPKRVIGWAAEDLSKISQCKVYSRMIIIANGSEIDPSTIEADKLNGADTGGTSLKQKVTYSSMGWDFTNVWAISEGEGYPYIIGSEQFLPKDPTDVASLIISPIAAVTYNGSAQTPAVTVIDGPMTLTNGTDYTVSYSNNINAGTATVTITGKGNYTGTRTENFTINAKSASNLTISSISSRVYTGSAQTPTVTVKDGTMTLTNGTDYTVSYSNNINVGIATVTVTGKGNYTGAKTTTFTIIAKSASNLTINSIAAVTYNGSAQTPTVTVKDGTTTLVSGTDYTVAYSNNINAGTASVTITGKGNYTGTKTTTFTIQKASLTVTAKSYTINQGDPIPIFEAYYTGFVNGETSSVLTTQPIFNCSASSTSTPGEYPITVSGAEAGNYEISYAAGKLIVTETDLVTVTAKSYTRKYGEANPTFEFTSEGAALEGTPEISCEATATSPAGTYPIVIKKGSVTNYNVSYVDGVLTIEKAPLTIAAGTYSKKQGEAMPEFTLTYTGFKNEETKDVLTKQPVVSCDATADSAPGEYPITVTGAEAENYEISYTAGKLIVTEADPEPIIYDEDDVISVAEVSVSPSKSADFAIDLTNKTTGLTAYQFDLVLPIGFTIATNEKGKYLVSKTDRYEDDSQTLNVTKVEGDTNTYRVVCFSLSNEEITGENGAILNVVLNVNENIVDGTYEGNISNIVFTKTDGKQLKLKDAQFSMVITSIIPGDANGDGEVNVTDIVEIVNYIMERPSDKFIFAAADVNEDSEINVTDIVKVVSIIMSTNNARAFGTFGYDKSTIYDRLQLKANDDHTLSLSLENETGYVASQFDFVLSSGQTLEAITLNNKRSNGHALTYSQTSANTYRVVIYSLENQSYSDNIGELLNIAVSGRGAVTAENILFVTQGQEEKRFAPLSSQTTGINVIEQSEDLSNGDWYDLQGRKIVNPSRGHIPTGIYIINGKKYVVK